MTFFTPVKWASVPILFFSLSAVLTFSSRCFASEIVAYRVLHASPDEVVAALFTPQPAHKPSHAAPGEGSRLEKYFRLKSKTFRQDPITHQNQVILELLPTVPVVDNLMPSTEPIRIIMTKQSEVANQYNFDSRFEALHDKFFKAKISLSPHTSGCLLKVEVEDSNLSKTLLQAVNFTLKQLGLAFATPGEALQNDVAK